MARFSLSSWVAAAVVFVVLALATMRLVRREGFFGKIKDAVSGAANKVKDTAVGAFDKTKQVVGGVVGGAPPPPPPPQVTYVGRRWDGLDWSCPDNTIETGYDNARACISSPFHPPVWKPDAKGVWGHNCPAGTTPSGEGAWELKCDVGHVGRMYDEGAKKWICPGGTVDTGNTWEKSSWRDAQKQCRRVAPYTQRYVRGGKWVCPEGTKDTGMDWSKGTMGWAQCKWLGQ